jgi:choice-of-anchor A domain-containing protein
MFKNLRLLTGFAAVCLNQFQGLNAQSFAPTASAQNFNIFMKSSFTATSGTIQGPIALGSNLTLGGTVTFAAANSGTYPTGLANNASNYGAAIGGKVVHNSGSLSAVTTGSIRLADATGSHVWYTNAGNVPVNTKLTSAAGAFTSTPALQAGNIQAAGTATGNTGIDFNAAFLDFIDFSTRINSWQGSADPSLNKITIPSTANPHITLVTDRINYVNLNAAGLANLASRGQLVFDNHPLENRILVVNVNAPGTVTWTPPNTGGFDIADGAFVIWNFYNTTSLTINGNKFVPGTVLAPLASLNFTNSNGALGQLISDNITLASGNAVIRYLPFRTTLSDLPEAIILPLHSIQLHGILNGRTVELLWDVEEEVDIATYIVERSTDGINFSQAGEVRSTGDHARYTYGYNDLEPDLTVPVLSYRIKVVENSGHFFYSAIKSLKITRQGDWVYWPNPVKSVLNLSFRTAFAGKAQLRIVNAAGQVLVQQSIQTQAGLNQATLNNLEFLVPGTYFLELFDERRERIGVGKIIK